MNSQTLFQVQAMSPRTRGTAPAKFLLCIALLTALSVTGCVGLTGAGTPAGQTNSDNASSGSLAASATNLTFGSIATKASSAQTLTLTNTGTTAVTISQATISGAGFSIAGG